MLINSERMKKLREDHGYTQEFVAHYLGVTEATVSRYESGNIKRVSPKVIMGYAELFSVDPSTLYENPMSEWLPAFSGAGKHDPRVRGFIEYLEEQAEKEEASNLSSRETLIIERYRTADDKVRRTIDYMLEIPPGEE